MQFQAHLPVGCYVVLGHPGLSQRLRQVADDPVGVLVGQPGQTGMRGAQIMPGVPLRARRAP
ncbi:MAG TPA: hypothetical protein VLL69_01035 [Streptosporangiaceae bacterium]|nr:hypothetical protein [Streptosporangiaceae bacterium]